MGALIDLGKFLAMLASILSLYWSAVAAFFTVNADWSERLMLLALKLVIACCISVVSGMVFSLPLRANPDAGEPLLQTLPVQLFCWGAMCIVAIFLLSWYLTSGSPCLHGIDPNCVAV
jgi:undecaprenyl pyrophosphate phosphatase UppP